MFKRIFSLLISLFLLTTLGACENKKSKTTKSNKQNLVKIHNKEEALDFKKVETVNWKEVFFDKGTEKWQDKWFLDGEVGKVKNDERGMTLTAGPTFKVDAHHMVLWTKESFKGDVKIEYEYTRRDAEKQCVTILYIQATGSGKEPYEKDISKWNELRKVPSMKTYFNNMNTFHISYAAFPNKGKERNQYIRGRRYMPQKKGLKGTDLKPDYYPVGLFDKDVKHLVTVIKKDKNVFMKIENDKQIYYCNMKNEKLPAINEGRIGLRHMFTRSATYKNFKVSIAE